MECLPHNEILEFKENTLELVRQKHGLEDPTVIAHKVNELDKWVKSQKHFLKNDFPKHNLETILISAKGSMEKAKWRIDKYCTLRTASPNYFGDCDLKNDFSSVQGKIFQSVLPKLTKDYSRIFVFKWVKGTIPSDIMAQGSKMMFMFTEYLRSHDYNDGYHIVVDYRNCNLFSMMTKMTYSELSKVSSIFIDGYGSRIKGVHYITSSVIINILVAVFKRVVNAKIASRFHVHRDVDTLRNILQDDIDIMPEEYGGKEKSLQKLHDKWMDVLSSEEFRTYLREMNFGVDESLRQTDNS